MALALLDAFLLMLYFSLFFLWIWLLISVLSDLFRSKDLGGVAKAAWVVLLVVLPYLGVLIYLIARGGGMHERAVAEAEAARSAAERYIREVAVSPSIASELTMLADLRDRGVLSGNEFNMHKAKLLA
ncbi:MAG: SHOCT domain-containing protein [Nitriliruptoraceae bacterium]